MVIAGPGDWRGKGWTEYVHCTHVLGNCVRARGFGVYIDICILCIHKYCRMVPLFYCIYSLGTWLGWQEYGASYNGSIKLKGIEIIQSYEHDQPIAYILLFFFSDCDKKCRSDDRSRFGPISWEESSQQPDMPRRKDYRWTPIHFTAILFRTLHHQPLSNCFASGPIETQGCHRKWVRGEIREKRGDFVPGGVYSKKSPSPYQTKHQSRISLLKEAFFSWRSSVSLRRRTN